MINSRKHIVQIPIATVASTALAKILLAESVQDVDQTIASDVQVGATVKAVYIELWLLAEGTATSSVNVNFQKKPSGAGNMTATQAGALHTFAGKNDVFYITQGVAGDENTNPVSFLRGWFKIPKGKQRMAFGEQLVLNITALAIATQFCGVVIYKEYF